MASSLPPTTQQNAATVVVVEENTTPVLKLGKPKTDKKLKWTEETVDNENMGKKKSKCCCIYKKQKFFGESSSDESGPDETDHCRGHKGKCYHASGGPPNIEPTDNSTAPSP